MTEFTPEPAPYTNTKGYVQTKKVGQLFDKLCTVLWKQLSYSTEHNGPPPRECVLREARQFLKDFSELIPRETIQGISRAAVVGEEKTRGPYPFSPTGVDADGNLLGRKS